MTTQSAGRAGARVPTTAATPRSTNAPPSAAGAPKQRVALGRTLPTGASKQPAFAPFAGTVHAERLQAAVTKGQTSAPKDVVVEGPSAFSPDAVKAAPSKVGSVVNRVGVWTDFQMDPDRKDRILPWSNTRTHGTVAAKEVLALTKEKGPDGQPKLRPGDLLLNGTGGVTGHMSIYVGDDPATGKPMLVHSMATAQTQKSWVGLAVEAGKSALQTVTGGGSGKVGVIREGMEEFFDRFPRDSYVVLRDPRLSDAMRERGLDRVNALVGKGYDYDFGLKNDTYYCSEIGLELLKAAYQDSGKALPWVGTTSISKLTLDSYVATPQNFAASPDFVVTAANDAGAKAFAKVVDTHVVGAKGPGAAVGTAATLEAVLTR